MKSNFFTLLFGLFIIPSVIGWGDEGHQITGYIAQKLLNPEVDNDVVAIIQEPDYDGQLANLAYWADYVTDKYPWSKELHFADTHDNPPETCYVDYGQNCPGDRCLMGAIVNYTQRLDCGSGLDAFQRDEALKFLTHFMGDITQPLHVSGNRGGSKTKVKIKKKIQKRSLHYVWDLDIPRAILKESFNKDFTLYAEYLLEKIRAEYADEVESWYACNVNDLPNLLECVLPWAVEINALNCEFAWRYTKGELLFEGEPSYYQRSKPIVDKLLAKGGYRLARLLNDLLSKASCGSTGDEEKSHNDDEEGEGLNDDDVEEGHNDDDDEEGHNDDDEEEGHNDDDEEEGHNDDEDDD